MTREQALVQLQRLFDDLFIEPVRVTPSLRAKDVPEWDSLMQINIVTAVEKGFGVRFRIGEVEKAHDVGAFVDLILERQTRGG